MRRNRNAGTRRPRWVAVVVLAAMAAACGSDDADTGGSASDSTSISSEGAGGEPGAGSEPGTSPPTTGGESATAEPLTLSLATEEHEGSPAALMIELFADEVERSSDGQVGIEVTYGAADGGAAWDQKVIDKVADGEYELVVARAGSWGASGVTALDVLQLPGLVDTDEQADRLVADRDLVVQLLADLDTAGFTGLGLYPEAPRYLMMLDASTGFSLDDLAGRVIRAPLSETVFDVLAAAGMEPIDLTAADFTVEVPEGTVDATEGHLARVELTTTVDGDSDAVVATNLALYTKFLVLAARTDALDGPTTELLLAAAEATVASFTGQRPREADSLEGACTAGGVLVQMTSEEREAFLDAVAPVVEAFVTGPKGDLWDAVAATAGPAGPTDWSCPDAPTPDVDSTSPEASAPSNPGVGALTLPTKRSDVVPTPGDLPDGVYRFTQTVEVLLESDPGGQYSAADEFIGEYVLQGGTAELLYFNADGTPMAGEPPSTDGVYQVEGDLMIFAAPPERAIPGTTGMYLLRWEFDGDTLTLEQIDDSTVDADFIAPWTRVGDVP